MGLSTLLNSSFTTDSGAQLIVKTLECVTQSTECEKMKELGKDAVTKTQTLDDQNRRNIDMIRTLSTIENTGSTMDEYIMNLHNEQERTLEKATDLSIALLESRSRVEEMEKELRLLKRELAEANEQRGISGATKHGIQVAENLLRNKLALVRTISTDTSSIDSSIHQVTTSNNNITPGSFHGSLHAAQASLLRVSNGFNFKNLYGGDTNKSEHTSS